MEWCGAHTRCATFCICGTLIKKERKKEWLTLCEVRSHCKLQWISNQIQIERLRNLLSRKETVCVNTHTDRQTDRRYVKTKRSEIALHFSRLATSIRTGTVNGIARNNELNLIRVRVIRPISRGTSIPLSLLVIVGTHGWVVDHSHSFRATRTLWAKRWKGKRRETT